MVKVKAQNVSFTFISLVLSLFTSNYAKEKEITRTDYDTRARLTTTFPKCMIQIKSQVFFF